MANQNPEQKSRDTIDSLLTAAGWDVQNAKEIDWSKSMGIAVREYPTEIGPADYILFVNQDPIGVIEAKRVEEGHRLNSVIEQTSGYAESKLKYLNNKPLYFRYESTGIRTQFTDIRDPKPRSRDIFTFHRPESLHEMLLEKKSLRGRLQDLPELPKISLRECQFIAVQNLEKSFKQNRPRALIQMATGAGKTFTAITFAYRLLKFSHAKRILFLVDTKNLGEQAEQEFNAFTPTDDNRKFTEIYNVTRLKSRYIPTDSQVYISTIQRLFSILKGEDLDESAEEINPNENPLKLGQQTFVEYNEKIPIEFFDFIVIDECHRSIYNTWKQVLDYFDAFLIGLTATPDKRTFGFFNENIVSEYSHIKAVADGVNVGFEVYLIETEITQSGAQLKAKEFVDKRERLTRKTRWEQIDDDLVYTKMSLDRDIVNPSQIRTIIKTFKQALLEIFPYRKEVPKTLIFAKTDSHADDIITIVREEFEDGNSFCKKITYRSEEDSKSVLSQFRNEYNPRIAVTVDMIATGTDVKPIECLIFMRDVRSKNYFEQMLGRGTRTLGEDDLKRVSPSALTAKTHFVVFDTVGVTKSCKTEMRVLEKKRTEPLKKLLEAVLSGNKEEDVYSSLANRLIQLDKELSPQEKQEFIKLANGQTALNIAKALLDAHDPDIIEETARLNFELPGEQELEQIQIDTTKEKLCKKVQAMLNGKLNIFIEKVQKTHEQVIDRTNIDSVKFSGWGENKEENAKLLVKDFNQFIMDNKDEITALKILFNEPHNRKKITHNMIQDVSNVLKANKPYLAPILVYDAYAALDNVKNGSPTKELIAIVSLIRRVAGVDNKITEYSRTVDKNFQKWVMKMQAGSLKFNAEQMEWLRLIKEHIISSFHIEQEDFERAPFDSKGGLGKMFSIFGDKMDLIIEEINEALSA